MSAARLRLCLFVGLLAFLTLGAPVAYLSAQGLPDTGSAETHQSRNLWQHVPGGPPTIAANGAEPAVRPRRFSALTLDRGGIAAHLMGAPREFTRRAREQPLVISLPTPGGGFERFALRESPIMEPALAARHPDIKTYSGRGIDNPAATIRADVTPLGFHASVRGPGGAWYVNPYYQRDDGLYVSYYGRDLEGSQGLFIEPEVPPGITVDRGYYHPTDPVELSGAGFTANAPLTVTIAGVTGRPPRVIDLQVDEDGVFHTTLVADPYDELGTHTVEASDGTNAASVTYDVVSPDDTTVDPPVGDQLRTYRLALLSDPGYATYFGAANVTAAKVTLINRVTQIYEEETSIRLVLIAGNDALNLNTAALMTGANGPCGGAACFTAAQATSCTSSTLTRTREVIGLLVGASNFDVGHIALGTSGGGLAALGVVGGNNKAQGCTGITTPVGDLFAVDYVAHELGHQFAGNHTFNGVTLNCSGGNRNAATSVEPGSGSSIMAYAGICDTDDLQPHSDPYWSAKSADEIINYTAAAEGSLNEVLMGALTGFSGTDSFRLQYNGNLSAIVTRGTNFTTGGVQAAIQGIAGWPAGGTATVSVLSDTAFTVTFGGTLAATDVSPLTLMNCIGCTGYVGEITKGGLTTHGGTVTATGNNFPAVTAPVSFTIPIRTPFALTGSALDPDGDTLTYMWEQTDRAGAAGTSLVSNTKTNGPLFRQFGTAAIVSGSDTIQYNSPGENQTTIDPTRVFPDLAQILANNTNAATGTCPAASNPPTPSQIDCFSEFLPTAGYVGFAGVNASPLSLHFRLTARDGRGGVNSGATTLLLATGAGPFLVTFPNTSVTLDKNVSHTVTWNPANTAAAPVSTANVKISLSIDGGLTYPYTLAASTANDGSETVLFPDVDTASARVKVEAIGNIFFDVSNSDFTIGTGIPADPLVGTWSGLTAGSLPVKIWVTGNPAVIHGYSIPGPCYTFTKTDPAGIPIAGGDFTDSISSVGIFAGTFADATTATGTIDFEDPASCPASPSFHTTWTATHVDSSPLPLVSVAATDPDATEAAADTGTFTITRTGSTADSVSVAYTMSGLATNGVDYTTLSGSATIPAGQASVTVVVSPINDTQPDGPETAVLTLGVGPAYLLGAPTVATVTIADPPTTVSVAATDPNASEVGLDPGTFTFTRTGPTAAALTVNFSTAGSTATVATDYANTVGTTVIIPAGQATATTTVTPVGDAEVEAAETVVVTLSPGSFPYTIGSPATATVTIADQPVPLVTIVATDPDAYEFGVDTGTFTFTRTGSTAGSLLVNYTIGGTASHGTDYDFIFSPVTIPAGQASVTLVVVPHSDGVEPTPETVILTLADGANYDPGSPSVATVTIADTSQTVTVAATDPAASEVGPDLGTFTFSRTGPTTSALTVHFGTSGSATVGTDFEDTGWTLGATIVIPAGQASVTKNVTPVADAVVDADETVIVTLTSNSAYNVGTPSSATVTIADQPVPLVTIVATDPEAYEAGIDTGTFTFTRTGSTAGALSVKYTIGGTASHGTDYDFIFSPVSIPSGQASVTLVVVPHSDGAEPTPETVILTLLDDANYDLGAPSAATVTITDTAPVLPTVTVTATDASASEVGPDPGTFTFTRTGATTAALTVNFTTTGSATVVTDYADVGWTSVTIPIGQASVTKTVTPVTDVDPDPGETVVVTLTAGSYTVGAPSAATVTIADAPVLPTVTVTATDASASEVGPDPGTFTFTRTGATTAALTVNFTTTGSATVVTDYADVGWTSVTIPIGQASVTKTVTPVTDVVPDPGETVVVTLTAGSYTVGAPSAATVTIADAPVAGVDLAETAVSAPPATASPGSSYVVTDTVTNHGGSLAGASTTRYYLSLDMVKGSGDVRLNGTRAVPSLAASATSTGPTTVTIPTSLAPGVYWQFACADDTKLVTEVNETNNCLISASTVQVLLPDLLETVVGNPPGSVAPGGKFTITDTVLNQGTVSAAASTTQYYLSVDAVKSAGDVLLAGKRSVGILTAGTTSPGSTQVTVPLGTAPGTYRVLACADDLAKVSESNESNNCVAAVASVVVGVPDLITTQVTGLPATAAAGTKVTLTDTVLNQGTAPTVATKTQYYLSVDGVWSAGDVLLTGSRSVPILAPSMTSAGSKGATIPLGTPAGAYFALACADDTKKVTEGNEANNCVASAGTIVVGP